MDMQKEMIIKILEESEIKIVGLDSLIRNRCYRALEDIISVVRTAEYDDKECFARIEKIVLALEKIGLSGGCRHDF